MPKAFGTAGWLLSLIIVITLCFMSFVTVTFVIECMSLANKVVKTRKLSAISHAKEVEDDRDTVSESSRLLDINSDDPPVDDNVSRASSSSRSSRSRKLQFDITHRVELGTMARHFLPSLAVKFFYTAIAVYLYGDLVIYAAAISKSIRDVSW